MGIIRGFIGPWADNTTLFVCNIWEAYRVPIIFSTCSVLFLVWIYLFFNEGREGLIAFPRQYAADKNKLPPALTRKQTLDLDSKATKKASYKPTSKGPRRIIGNAPKTNTRKYSSNREERDIQVIVFFSSLTGKSMHAATKFGEIFQTRLSESLSAHGKINVLKTQILNIAEIDFDEYFITAPKSQETNREIDYLYLILIPSYNIDTINDTFLEHLKETHNDFRIDTAPLRGLIGYSVFGLGEREGWRTEEEGFCFQAKEVDHWMAKLTGRKRAFPLGMGDSKIDAEVRLNEWAEGIVDVLRLVCDTGSLGEGVRGSGDANESDEEDISELEEDGEDMAEKASYQAKRSKRRDLQDVEDLGKMIAPPSDPLVKKSNNDGSDRAPIAIDFTTYSKFSPKPVPQIKEMVPKSSPTYSALTKQGYSIIGSHSGVKTCRWTKSALRGRGSCYKYSFYGIASHQCMEATPSLSCSNKCVFCWRHGTNPVGTTWRWVVDPPVPIFTGMKEAHYKKIKMMRGVPGVRAERFAEAMRIRHCALSLVGEPIFYPHINEFLALLHGDEISSFLVCNAQHPDQLQSLHKVTQLYVSIDASDKDTLRRIDRPLHRDFWERFQRCLEILREKRFQQRTVFRLTLVKGFNVDEEIRGYADLIEKALPCFVEIKGVTYCGTSTAVGAGLTMANVPFWNEVQDFVTALSNELQRRDLGYGIAAEHQHSCCALIGSERFRKNGKWHTRIDYNRFFELWKERGPEGEWTPEEYIDPEPTPEWATWGKGGFDPRDVRVDRKGRKIET